MTAAPAPAAPAAALQAAAAPLLEARAFTLRAGGRALVERLQWSVHAGERWCVIGRNGAGKSLVLRALAGLAVPERAGDVLWQGRTQPAWPVGAAAAVRALMPQQAQDRFALTVARTLALSQVAAPRDGDAHARHVAELLAALDIAHLAAHCASAWTHGGAWVASAHDPSWIARVATHVLALSGEGRWRAGPVDEILREDVLEATYGCPWRHVEGAWLPL